MPNNKNQHFVPKCALRPFAILPDARAINVFNISSKRAIESASVKNQCSRDYFYGTKLGLEQNLAVLEGHYATISRKLIAGGIPSKSEQDWLRLFVSIQNRRTLRAVEEIRNLTEAMADAAFSKHPDQRDPTPDFQWFVHTSMRVGLKTHSYSTDLKFVVIQNCTSEDFITSDHPVVFSNRFAFEILKNRTFGMSNSGAFLAMPVSPRLLVLAFDIQTYTVSIPQGTLIVKTSAVQDVRAFNELQALSAHNNIYFARWEMRDAIKSLVDRVGSKRANLNDEVVKLIRDTALPGKVFRKGTASEEKEARQMLLSASFDHPFPSEWPKLLKLRSRPVSYSDGSMVGHVRKKDWLKTRR